MFITHRANGAVDLTELKPGSLIRRNNTQDVYYVWAIHNSKIYFGPHNSILGITNVLYYNQFLVDYVILTELEEQLL